MVHKASHWFLTTETAVQSQANLSATCGGLSVSPIALITEVMQNSQT